MERYKETYRMWKRVTNNLKTECLEFLTDSLQENNAMSIEDGCYVYSEKYESDRYEDTQSRCEVIGYGLQGKQLVLALDESDFNPYVEDLKLSDLVKLCMSVEENVAHKTFSFEEDIEDCMNY